MLTLVGTSHHIAPIEAREQLAIPPEALQAVLTHLGERFGASAIVNTCNRIEMYLPGEHNRDAVIDCFVQATGADRALADQYFDVHHDVDAVRHLYPVAAGADSMVLGESEVLGQVRSAFSAAIAAGTDDALLSRLFHTAIRTGRRVRTETEIGHHTVSVSSISVQQARLHHDDLQHATVLLLGAGEAGRLAARALVEHGVGDLLVVNRTPERAEAVASELGGRTLTLDRLIEALRQADIAIAAADAPEPLVTQTTVAAAMATRMARPLLIVDIGMPRDCEAAVADVPGVTYYDLDDLQAIAAEHHAARAGELEHVTAIIEEEAANFLGWWDQLQVIPSIAAITERAEQLRAAEVTKSLRRMGLTDEQQTHLDTLTKAIVRQVLHDPITTLRERGDRDATLDAARQLFRLDEAPRTTGGS